jgi:hypothetical protein
METISAVAIPRVVTRSRDPDEAAGELHGALSPSQPALVILFADPESDLEALGPSLAHRFGGVPVIGCTTAGEITSAGYEDACLAAVGLPAAHFTVATGTIDGLNHIEMIEHQTLCSRLVESLKTRGKEPSPDDTFAMLLIDGLSVREEAVTNSLAGALGKFPLFGGSAGDGLRFARTAVLHEGAFRSDRAVLALIQTDLPFAVFKAQHFVPSRQKMVVTSADTARRVVKELNGEPAAREYARLVGVKMADLDPVIFATSPVVVRIGGDTFVRSIQRVNDDESLTFFCAIDEGIVLTLAEGVDLIDNLKANFQQLRSKVGEIELVLGCDCILRRLEVQRKELESAAARVFADNKVIGFSTYGEQWNAMHVNQTFTGVAFGMASRPHD